MRFLSQTCLMIKSIIGTDYKESFRSCYTICLKSIHFKNKPVFLYYKRIKTYFYTFLSFWYKHYTKLQEVIKNVDVFVA